jgi:hypothetical protein
MFRTCVRSIPFGLCRGRWGVISQVAGSISHANAERVRVWRLGGDEAILMLVVIDAKQTL